MGGLLIITRNYKALFLSYLGTRYIYICMHVSGKEKYENTWAVCNRNEGNYMHAIRKRKGHYTPTRRGKTMVYDPTSPPFLFFSLLEKFLFIRGEGGFNDSSLSRELFSPFRGLFQTGCSVWFDEAGGEKGLVFEILRGYENCKLKLSRICNVC